MSFFGDIKDAFTSEGFEQLGDLMKDGFEDMKDDLNKINIFRDVSEEEYWHFRLTCRRSEPLSQCEEELYAKFLARKAAEAAAEIEKEIDEQKRKEFEQSKKEAAERNGRLAQMDEAVHDLFAQFTDYRNLSAEEKQALLDHAAAMGFDGDCESAVEALNRQYDYGLHDYGSNEHHTRIMTEIESIVRHYQELKAELGR